MWFHAKVGTGSENAMYNNISQCSYSFKEDDKLLKQALQNELEIKQVTKSTEKKQVEREFTNAYRQRYYHRAACKMNLIGTCFQSNPMDISNRRKPFKLVFKSY